MPRTKADALPRYLYRRGNRLWMRVRDMKGAWVCRKTPYLLHEVDLAERFVTATIKGVAERLEDASKAISPTSTVNAYANAWLKDRDARGLAAVVDDRIRLKHILPHIGHLPLNEVRPKHLRDAVRAMRALKTMAPRSVRHAYMSAHCMFSSAVIDELLPTNPCKLEKNELPAKVDADPEWRANATYTHAEIIRIISDPIIPVERRVLHALKALLGIRHGEASAIKWRHYDETATPLARVNILVAYSSRHKIEKSTKTEVTRAVPCHPLLGKILRAWRDTCWPRVYGRSPSPDDLIVPTRNFTNVACKDAGEGLQSDLKALGLRQQAGKKRKRGGHDMRSWFITALIDAGADSLLVRRFTHAVGKDVQSGYERFAWATYCREVLKLQIDLSDEDVLRSSADSVQAELRARNRWPIVVTPLGLERDSVKEHLHINANISTVLVDTLHTNASENVPGVTKAGRHSPERLMKTAARMLDHAARLGDLPRILEIAAQLKVLGTK